MTESQDEKFEGQEESFLLKDPMLATLVNFAEQGISLGVTLTVHGLLVSGNIISFREYLEGIAQSLEAASNQEVGSILAESYRGMSQEYYKLLQEKELNEVAPRYIHLSNAKFILGSSIVPTKAGLYWRGQLDEVDGFSFGAMSASEE